MAVPKFRPFKNTEIKNFTALLCDGYLVEGAESMPDFLVGCRVKSAAHPDCTLLTTLDDLHQAFYTSGHAINYHDIDCADGHDLTGLDPAAYEDDEHLGYLTTISEFPIRRANFLKKAEGVTFADLAGKLMWDGDPDKPDFFALNASPDDAIDQVMLVQVVPVEAAADALCAFPNGYFTSDLSPFENHALARHLEVSYGYALFGIGASYVGFLKTRAIGNEERAALARDLCSLFSDGAGSDFEARIADTIVRSPWLLLRYVCG